MSPSQLQAEAKRHEFIKMCVFRSGQYGDERAWAALDDDLKVRLARPHCSAHRPRRALSGIGSFTLPFLRLCFWTPRAQSAESAAPSAFFKSEGLSVQDRVESHGD